ncbi:hypothetical protein B5G43_02870 [Flavonifractor sp. An92]|uniref:DUF4376 domain-containing protein n=1 Tax=Flavonifractor sp. An92 TaxID=1965666 RepID=UPI000B365E9B|nr:MULTISPECIES: DUF4376 domain-containing protein [unclassified Flavonifractor]OUN08338.1 hypothetical protein B5G43_02870 [Flavonifractor sp. An92]OUQ22127.1 hypothetical protein B5E80_15115 [Flavonifractor sp. An135]
MNIIQLNPSITGSRPPIQSWPGSAPPSGYAAVAPDCDTSAMQTHNGHVDLTIENGVVAAIIGNDEAYQAYLASVAPDIEVELAEAKATRIQQSKDDLESYLEAHPITWTDGKQYSITREKQQQLTSKILSATLAAQTSTPYELTWNATGAECTPWTLEELAALAFAIDARVTALVSYQQSQEVAMQAATTMEELEGVTVDYDTVQ